MQQLTLFPVLPTDGVNERWEERKTGMIEGKSSRGKKREMMLDGLTKQLKVDRGRSTESDEGYKSMEGHDCLH